MKPLTVIVAVIIGLMSILTGCAAPPHRRSHGLRREVKGHRASPRSERAQPSRADGVAYGGEAGWLVASRTPPIDVVLVVDESASNKRTDPNRLRLVSSNMFVDLLREGKDWLAVIGFAGGVRVLIPLTQVRNPATRRELQSAIEEVVSSGQWTDLTRAIKAAATHLTANGNPQHRCYILVLSDGGIDVQGGANAIANSRRELLEKVLTEVKAQGIVVYGVGFSASLDESLMRQMVEATQRVIAGKKRGLYERSPTAEAVSPVFARVFANMIDMDALPPDVRGSRARRLTPSGGAGGHERSGAGNSGKTAGSSALFHLDDMVVHATFTVNKNPGVQGGGGNVKLYLPGSLEPVTAATAKTLGSGARWIENPAYCIISLPEPSPGLYRVEAGKGSEIQCFIERPDIVIKSYDAQGVTIFPFWDTYGHWFVARSLIDRPAALRLALNKVDGIPQGQVQATLKQDGTRVAEVAVPPRKSVPFEVALRQSWIWGVRTRPASAVLGFPPATSNVRVRPREVPIHFRAVPFLLVLLMLLLALVCAAFVAANGYAGYQAWRERIVIPQDVQIIRHLVTGRPWQRGKVVVRSKDKERRYGLWLCNLLFLHISRRIRLTRDLRLKAWVDSYAGYPELMLEVRDRGVPRSYHSLSPGKTVSVGEYTIGYER